LVFDFFDHVISKILFRDEWPETKRTRDGAILKNSASDSCIAMFAWPSFGGSRTATLKCASSICSTFGAFDFGLAFTKIFTLSSRLKIRAQGQDP
jgi:hypothetical protein